LGIKDFLEGGHLAAGRTRKQPISFASYRKHIFCDCCNQHFKRLEDSVIPLAVPMARGLALGLGVDSQEVLALWASKTAIALIAANNVENPPDSAIFVPTDHCVSVREAGRPSDDVWVGYVPWHGSPIVAAGEAVLVDPQDGVTKFEAYVVVLAFEKVAFKVVGFTTSVPPTHTIHGNRASISQFWPLPGGLIHWPALGPPATNATLGALLNFVPLRTTRLP
jgi:hypothetical protein